MYLRQLPGTTLADLASEFNQSLTTWGGGAHQITPHLDEDEPHVSFGQHDVYTNKDGMMAMAKFFDIPPKFFVRLDREQQQFLLRTQIDKDDRDVTAYYSDRSGLSEIRPSGEVRVRPHKLVEGLLTSFPENSPIVDSWNDANELRIDVIFPEDHKLGQAGDLKIGDVSRGGIRVFQDRKINSAPQIEKLIWRFVCTNGMEVADPGLKVSAVGATELEIYALFEAEVHRAVDVLMDDINHFYDLRTQTVGDDPTGTLRRLALEQGLPGRTVGNLEDLIPTLENGADTTVFDLVNLITNQANNPAIDARSSTHRNLQRAGGGVVTDHAERCTTCHSRLGR